MRMLSAGTIFDGQEKRLAGGRRTGGGWAAVAMAVAVLLALTGCVTTTPAPRVSLAEVPAAQQARAEHNVKVFNRAWSLVQDFHYDRKLQGVDWQAVGQTYGAMAAAATDDRELYTVLNGMVDLLKDSHTHALSPEQAEQRHKQLRARTGMYMTRFENRWAVSELLPGCPAEVAGVKPGWIVVARNGIKLGDRVDFRAQNGEVAQWEFLDEHEQPVTLMLTAQPLSTKPRQEARELPGGFMYLRFDGFDATDQRWLSRQLKAHHEAPGVVIDLRRNPGGSTLSLGILLGEFFDHAVDSGTFISRGSGRDETGSPIHYGERFAVAVEDAIVWSWHLFSSRYAGRVVILIDGSTASAGEIFSAVMQESGRATIIGRKSAGAVLASLFHSLPDGGELQLSMLDYLTPKGRRLENNGVEPDVKVATSLADLRAGRDVDLDAALRVLNEPVR